MGEEGKGDESNRVDIEAQNVAANASPKESNMSMSMSVKVGGKGGAHVLEVTDLSYTVSIKNDKETMEKTLIHPVSFKVKPCEMTAIMGASGAGKSTLLDILATRVQRDQVEGSYTCDGEPVGNDFNRMSGYVMQDDALYPLLTVRETLQFAAMLRIANVSKADKMSLVEETISQLKLENCANTWVGNEIHRGISGGEKRRVSIGVDTVQQPSIIFLDEPTSGLDSTTALTIVETLHEVCMRSRTVCMTIHQPSTRVFNAFDKVMFFSRGKLVYHGPPNDLPGYCTRLDKSPPAFSNIAEFFLEVVDEYESSNNVEALAIFYQGTARLREPSEGMPLGAGASLVKHDFANGVVMETGILLQRQFKNVLRTPELAVIRCAMAAVMALVLGSLFWGSNTDEGGLGKRSAYIAFTLALFLFTSLEALPIFMNERVVFMREYSRGAYRAVSYSLANMIIYLPVCILLSIVFNAISYFMVDMPAEGFGFQVFVIFMVLLEGNAFATLVSGLAPDPLTGNGLGTALMAFMFLFSGFFVPNESIPVGWRWFSYLSMFKYPFEGLMKNMLDEEVEDGDLDQASADDYASRISVDISDVWVGIYGPLVFVVVFRTAFTLVLRAKHSGSRR